MRKHTPSASLLMGVAVAALSLAACGDDSSSDSTSPPAEAATTIEPPTVTSGPAVAADVVDGAVEIDVTIGTDDFTTSGGTRVVSVPQGTSVTVVLTDPNADQEYHLHGYELEASAAKGEPATMSFVADQTGQFDLESHHTEDVLLVIVVE